MAGIAQHAQREHGQRRPLRPPTHILHHHRRDTLGFLQALRGVKRTNHAHGPDEPVPLANYGFQEARLGRVVAQSAADFAHQVVDVSFCVNERRRLPKSALDVFS
jgi:hypothetical protein